MAGTSRLGVDQADQLGTADGESLLARLYSLGLLVLPSRRSWPKLVGRVSWLSGS